VKWFIACLVAVIIAAVAWITSQDFRSFDPRLAVSRATVVGYGHVVASSPPHIVIDEIWKPYASSQAVAIGTFVPFPAPSGSADRVLVCFHSTFAVSPACSLCYSRQSRWPHWLSFDLIVRN